MHCTNFVYRVGAAEGIPESELDVVDVGRSGGRFDALDLVCGQWRRGEISWARGFVAGASRRLVVMFSDDSFDHFVDIFHALHQAVLQEDIHFTFI